MSTATQTPAHVLLDVQNVAIELGIDEVEARRLVAKKLIAAARMGENGPVRVTPEALSAYAKKGARGVRIPGEWKPGQAWFSDDKFLADAFEAAVRNAALEQVPSEDRLRQDFERDKFAITRDYKIENRGAVAEVLSRPVPQQIFGNTPSGERETRFRNWSELYAVYLLRKAARKDILSRKLMEPPIRSLYRTPEQFEAIADAAYADVARRRIVFSKSLSEYYTHDHWHVKCGLRMRLSSTCMEGAQCQLVARQSFTRFPMPSGNGSIWLSRFTRPVVKVGVRDCRCGTS